MYGCDASALFALKCMVKTYPMRIIISMLTMTMFIFANAVRICEAPRIRIDDGSMPHIYMNSIWEVILTMTTVGFGDIFPRTIFGRIFMIMCALMGVVIISMMVLTVTNTFQFDSLENRAFIVTAKVFKKKEINSTSSRLLQKFFRILLNRKKGVEPNGKQLIDMKVLSQKLKTIINDHKSLKEPNMKDSISSEFENANNTQKEMLLYVGIVGRMLLYREIEAVKECLTEEEKVYANVILGLVERPDINKVKEQHENQLKIREKAKEAREIHAQLESENREKWLSDSHSLMVGKKGILNKSKFGKHEHERGHSIIKINPFSLAAPEPSNGSHSRQPSEKDIKQ